MEGDRHRAAEVRLVGEEVEIAQALAGDARLVHQHVVAVEFLRPVREHRGRLELLHLAVDHRDELVALQVLDAPAGVVMSTRSSQPRMPAASFASAMRCL